MANTPKQLTKQDRLAIKALLDAHLMRISGSDLYEYRDGYSDEVIAKQVRVSTPQVKRLRHDWFGSLKKGSLTGVPKYGALVTKVNELIAEIALIQARLDAMTPMVAPPAAAANMNVGEQRSMAINGAGGTLR